MTSPSLPPELESRIQHLEDPKNQGAGFTQTDWAWLLFLGVIAPAALLVWGWV
ncbi:MAG: hypothetical protein AAGJ95_00030 [Cyanobacteria bacterium J06554_11]